MSKKMKILYALSLVLFIIAGYLTYSHLKNKSQPTPQPQTENTQLQTFTDKAQGITFQYSTQLTTKYIHTLEWPPKATVTNDLFKCVESSSEITPTGKTEKVTIGSNTFCVTKQSEGAAGSIYINYTYTIPENNKIVVLTFTLREVQCANYEDPQKTECENERNVFDINSIVNQIIPTIKITAITPPVTNINPLPKTNSGISGKVLLGPTCPVERNPPDPQCADKPYKVALTLTTKDGLQIIKQFSSDDNGNFTVNVTPGEYIIKSVSTNMLPRCNNTAVIKVISNMYTDTTIYCDTGIR